MITAHLLGSIPFFLFSIWYYSWYSIGNLYYNADSLLISTALFCLIFGILFSAIFDKKMRNFRKPRVVIAITTLASLLSASIPFISSFSFAFTAFLGSGILISLLLPPVLENFFSSIPKKHIGFAIGIAIGFMQAFWLLLFFLVSVIGQFTVLDLFFILAFLALCIGLSYFFFATSSASHESRTTPEKYAFSGAFLIIISVAFFLFHCLHMNSVAHVNFYEISYTSWLQYLLPLFAPVMGLLYDSFNFISVTVIGFLFSVQTPILLLLDTNVSLFWIIRSIDIFGFYSILLVFCIVYDRAAYKKDNPDLWRVLPYCFFIGTIGISYLYSSYLKVSSIYELGISLSLLSIILVLLPFSSQNIVKLMSDNDDEQDKAEHLQPVAIDYNIYLPKVISLLDLDNYHVSDFAIKYNLSKRESEVVKLLPLGLSNSEMSQKLFIAENTLKAHLTRVFKKTNTKNRNQLIALLLETQEN